MKRHAGEAEREQDRKLGLITETCRTNLGFQTPRLEIQSLDQTHTSNNDDIIMSADPRGCSQSHADITAFMKNGKCTMTRRPEVCGHSSNMPTCLTVM